MQDADMPGLCDRQELQDDSDDDEEEVHPPVGPDEQDDPYMPYICEGVAFVFDLLGVAIGVLLFLLLALAIVTMIGNSHQSIAVVV
jgi:hypothetical protein